ncbi:MAG: hypothetical protein PUE71_00275 [Clostridia bacterium]|nr:hypothetical protein [Clostridia bacterium]
MKKSIKTIILVSIMAALVIGYYFYLSNRDSSEGKQEQKAAGAGNANAQELIVKDIGNNYPESPREVLKLYARITQAYYASDTTDEQVEKLGAQARLLFDDELKGKQTDEEFTAALKADVANYRSINRYVADYKVDSSVNFEYKTISGKSYAIGTVLYYVREGNQLSNAYHSYKLRKDENGRWKILYWELSSSKQMGDEK